MKPIYSVSVPDYSLDKRPNYGKVGEIIDGVIKSNLMGEDVAIRCLSLRDHPSKTIDSLIAIIEKEGTDKYDPKRKMSVAHNFYTKKGVDIFATPAKVTPDLALMKEIIKDFYEGALKDRGYSMKIDLIVVYDLAKLEQIPIQYDDGVGKDAFRFKNNNNKPEAIRGFIKIA